MWSVEEDAKLRELFGQGLKDDAIGEQLGGRSAGAISQRRSKLGLTKFGKKPKATSPKHYTETELAEIKQLVADGEGSTAIGKKFGRTRAAIQSLKFAKGWTYEKLAGTRPSRESAFPLRGATPAEVFADETSLPIVMPVVAELLKRNVSVVLHPTRTK